MLCMASLCSQTRYRISTRALEKDVILRPFTTPL